MIVYRTSLLIIVISSGVFSCSAVDNISIEMSLEKFKEELRSQYMLTPHLDGNVVDIVNTTTFCDVPRDIPEWIVINLGSKDGVKEGFDFAVYRDNIFICRMIVRKVSKSLSAGEPYLIVSQGTPVKVGDKVTTQVF
jgi:hypothetical protein